MYLVKVFGMSDNLEGYFSVAQRIVQFREKYPEGSLQPFSEIVIREVEGQTFLIYCAAAYRSPDDQRPGVGMAWEPVPGKTTFTKDSELQNAETSAWGRAIVAALAADTTNGIASREEVLNRRGPSPEEEEAPETTVRRAPPVQVVPQDDEEALAAELEKELASEPSVPEQSGAKTIPSCAECSGEIESEDQLDLANLRFRRPLCRTCFVALKGQGRRRSASLS